MDIRKSLTTAPSLDLTGPLDLITNIAAGQFAFQTFSLTTLNQPYTNYPATTYGSLEVNGPNGGLSINGFTGNGSTALTLSAVIGNAAATQPAFHFFPSKADGAGGLQAIAATEIAVEVNNIGTPIFDLYGNGELSLNGASRTGNSRLNIKSQALVSGTGTITNGGTGSVVGTGTLATTELAVGDKIVVATVPCTVTAIADNTHFTVDYFGSWTNASFTISKPLQRMIDSGGFVTGAWYQTGDLTATTLRTTTPISSICFGPLPGAGPQLIFGFGDDTVNHRWRSAGGSNLDLMIDVLNGSTHFFGINGLFKTGYGAVIGDSTFAASAPSNGLYVNGQVTIGSASPNASAKLDIISTTQGLGLPTMTTAEKNAIGSPRAGLLVFDSTLGTLSTYNGAIWV